MKKLPAKVVISTLKKAGIKLEKREMEALVKELAKSENPSKDLSDFIAKKSQENQ